MKALRMAAVIAAVASLSGCISFLTEIRVAADGSGTLVQTLSMNPQAFKGAMQELAKGMGGSAGDVKETTESDKPGEKGAKAEKSPFSADQLSEKAKDLGEGVTFVSAEPLETATAQGVRVTYRFRDVGKLFVNAKPGAALGAEGAGKSAPGAIRFRFERKAGSSILTVVLPPPKKTDAPPPESPAPDLTDDQLAMVKQMFKGMHLAVALAFDGRIVKTNSAFHTENRVTVMDLDFDPLLEKPETLKALNSRFTAATGDDRAMAAALSTLPGIKVDVQPEIRVEFAPR